MEKVYFLEKNHKYQNAKGELYDSVSSIWKPYFGEFNSDLISSKNAIRDVDLSLYNLMKKEIGYSSDVFISECLNNMTSTVIAEYEKVKAAYLADWRESSERGTRFHTFMENLDLERGVKVNPFTNKEVPVIYKDIKEGFQNESFGPNQFSDLLDGFVPEDLITNEELRVAGQADLRFTETINGVRYVDIDDYKTDKEMKVKPPNRFFKNMMNYPYDHLYDYNFWKYSLKISTYAFMLEQLGFTIRNLALTHVKVEEPSKGEFNILSQKRYPINYKRFEVSINPSMNNKNI